MIDLIYLLIIIFWLARGWFQGLLAVVARFFVTLVSVILAAFFSSEFSVFLSRIFVSSGMTGQLSQRLSERVAGQGMQSVGALADLGMPRHLSEKVAEAVNGYANVAIDQLVVKLSHMFATAMAFLFFFIVIQFFLILILKNSTRILHKIPIIGTLNRILGSGAGLLIGLLMCFVLAVALGWIAPFQETVGNLLRKSYLTELFTNGVIFRSLFDIIF